MSRLVLTLAIFFSIYFTTACTAMSSQPEQLKGTWVLDRLDNQDLEGNRIPYIDFLENDKIAGSTGCNRLGGKAIQSNGSIEFTGLISTKRACVELDVMRQERRILKALDSVVKLKHEKNSVHLINDQDKVIMTLSKKT